MRERERGRERERDRETHRERKSYIAVDSRMEGVRGTCFMCEYLFF